MSDDFRNLQGTWNITSLEIEGQTVPAGMLGAARIVIQDGNFISLAMGATYEGTFEVDAAKTPKTFNMNFTTGPEKGNTSPGIYELDGDTWKICLALRGDDRPTMFVTAPGSGHACETLKRAAQ
jgi:uncharacterized protein (TIGR03067 family)